MAATEVARPVRERPKERGHRLRLGLAVAAAVLVVVAIAVYGFDYYRLDRVARLPSPKHAQFRPSGSIGHKLGTFGGVLFLLIFLYPLRKRWPWLAKKGRTKHWLDFHILMGLLAPVVITFHSAFKLQGLAGLSYWIMMAVALSGIVGRYFYAQIPRRLDAAEMTWDELGALGAQLARQLESQTAVRPKEIAPLLRLPTIEQVQSLPLARALWMMVLLDLRRPFLLWRLKRRSGAFHSANSELKEVIAAVRKQAALAKKILFLSRAHQIFHLWHVVHRPFSYSFALLACLHVLVVLLLGY